MLAHYKLSLMLIKPAQSSKVESSFAQKLHLKSDFFFLFSGLRHQFLFQTALVVYLFTQAP